MTGREGGVRLEQINIRQGSWLLVTGITATLHLLFVRFAAHYAGRDGWIALILATLMGFVSLFIILRLIFVLPKQNLVQMSQTLLGPVAGRALGLLFVWYFIHVNALLLRNFGDFMRLVMPQTPLVVLIGVMLALVTYTARHGLEVLARANDGILPILVLVGSLASVLLTKDRQHHLLLPVLEHGWTPVLQGAISLQGLLSEMVVFAMFGCCLRPTDRPALQPLWAVVAIGLFGMGPISGPTAIFGIENARVMTYPTFEEIKRIDVAEFLANMDVSGILLWTLGAFVKGALFLWAAATGVATLANLGDYRAVVAPLALITGVLAFWIGENTVEMMRFLRGVYPVYAIAVGSLLPLLLLVLAGRRSRRRA